MKSAIISGCDAQDCAFNQNNKCHALAITIGGASDQFCDTYCPSKDKGGYPIARGMVGACKVVNCKHNEIFECNADHIEVGHWGKEVDCLNYTRKD